MNEPEQQAEIATETPANAAAPAKRERKPRAKQRKTSVKKESKTVKKTATKKSAEQSSPREPIDMAQARKRDYSIDVKGRVRVHCTNKQCEKGASGATYTGARATNLDAPCPRCGKDSIKPVINSEKKTPGRPANSAAKPTKRVAKQDAGKRAQRKAA